MNKPQKPFFSSELFDESTFYTTFLKDIKNCNREIIIESPFITTLRMNDFRSVFKRKIEDGVKIYIFTRDPQEHESTMALQAEAEIRYFECVGIQTLLSIGNHHRKLAILDRNILWEGSLNILSQYKSREIMRRIDNQGEATEMYNFLRLDKFT